MRRTALILASFPLLAATACAQYPGSQPPPDDLKVGFDAIKIRDAKNILNYLSTKCDGRGTGQPGYQKASEFVADQFHRLGLKPLGDGGTYFQKTTFTRSRITPESVHATVPGSDMNYGSRDITLFNGPDVVTASGPVVFVEYRGRTATLTSGADLTGKVAIVHGDVPNNRFASGLTRAGAVAVLTVMDKLPAPSWRPRMGDKAPGSSAAITGAISNRAADELRKANGIGSFEQPADNSAGVFTGTKGLKIDGTRVVEQVQVGNVVGLLEGSDPVLKNEYIGVGGHLDHLGIQNGLIYPGADDDGSGSTAVIEVARAMIANPKKPRRSIVFMTFFGEEMGLLGSRFLTEHPPVPLDHMVSELQMDMVGRDSDGVQNGDRKRVDVAAENIDTIRLVGSKRISTQLDQDIQDMNRYIGFKFKYDAEDVYTRSDHYNFAAKGIPIAFLFDGFHPDYHQPTDTIEKIDFAKLTNAAKLYYLTAHDVADADAAPIKDVPQGATPTRGGGGR